MNAAEASSRGPYNSGPPYPRSPLALRAETCDFQGIRVREIGRGALGELIKRQNHERSFRSLRAQSFVS
jgi:hypothetical protein